MSDDWDINGAEELIDWLRDNGRKVKVVSTHGKEGDLFVELHYVRVGYEYNYDEEILLNESMARALFDDLKQVLDER